MEECGWGGKEGKALNVDRLAERHRCSKTYAHTHTHTNTYKHIALPTFIYPKQEDPCLWVHEEVNVDLLRTGRLCKVERALGGGESSATLCVCVCFIYVRE
jgi:hypothetical protein